MNFARIALENRVTTWVVTVLLVGGGILAFQTMSALEDPEFTIKEALITTTYPGATAAEVAEEVTDRIEAAVQQLGQLDFIESISQPGLSIITVTVKDKYDASTLPQVWDELRRKVVDVQDRLPPGAGKPVVNDDFGDVFGVFLAVYGDGFTYRELKDYVDDLEKELILVPDVSKVALFGVRNEVIYVEILRARLAQLGISEDSIYNTLAERNLIQPAGRVDVGRELVRFVATGSLDSVEDIGNTVVQGILSDRQLLLRDIATITREYEEPPGASMRFEGRRAIGVGVSTVSGGNVVTMGAALQQRLDELIAETPIGIEIGEIYFQGNMVTAAVDSFVVSLMQAIAIVIGVLLFAMGVRSGILIGAILLLTVLATFMVMKAQGIALERISLGALVIALGMLVDNAIVVVEGILVRAQRGMDRATAAKEVVAQTTWPLFGATLVAIMAFGALGLSQDSTGEYCRSLFMVITYSLLLSWLLAVTVTPLLCVKFLAVEILPEGHDPYAGKMFRAYRGFLAACIKVRWVTVGVAVLLLALAVKGFGFVDQSFFPSSTTPAFTFDVWLPQGTDIRKTEAEMKRLEAHVRELEQVESASTYIGQGALRYLLTYAPEKFNTSYGQMIVQVGDFEDIASTIASLESWVGDEMPDALVFGKPYVLGPGGGSDIEARIRGKDPAVLRKLSRQVQDIMHADAAARDIRDDWREPVKIVRPQVLESQASRLGLSRRDVNDALQRNFDGLTIGLYREGDTLIPIKSRAPAHERVDVDNARDMQIWSPVARSAVPLRQMIAGLPTEWEDGNINRRDRLFTITAQCNAGVGNSSVLFERIRPQIEALDMQAGYSIDWGGEYEDSTKAQNALAANFGLTILVMMLIVIALFNSIKQPSIIWLTVPLALIGVTAGLLVSGEPFGFMALLGLLSLIGMLIKNAIVLIDEIDGQIKAGVPRYTAVLDSCVSRMRPVSMAAFTTVLGMIPLLPDVFFASLAVTVMGGLSFATILTLVVVPVLYCIFFRIKPSETGPVTENATAA